MTTITNYSNVTKWWRHQMETYSALLVNSPHRGQWRGALMFSLICALNKRLSNQSWGWWYQTPSCSLWRHCNGCANISQDAITKSKHICLCPFTFFLNSCFVLTCSSWFVHIRIQPCHSSGYSYHLLADSYYNPMYSHCCRIDSGVPGCNLK